jgi:acyl-CoA dehydrogenase
MLLLQIILIIAAITGIALLRLPMRVWAPGMAALFIILGLFTTPPWWFLVISVLVFISVVVGFAVPSVRQEMITKPLLARLRKTLPPISETERIALESGDVWLEAEFFTGRPNWKKFTNTVVPTLSSEEQAFLDNQVETLCGMLDDFKMVYEEHDMPQLVWDYLKKEGFFGMVIPKEYGGLGFSAIMHSTAVVKIASRSMSAAVNTMVPNSLGPGELLTHYGTDEQKNYYLPRLARGEEIPCFGLTAPEAGSDATAIPDTGIVCKGQFEGKEIIGIRLNFDKRYITLAPVATVIGLAFKMHDPEHLLGNKTDIGITLCLIPANLPGVDTGARHFPLGLAFMNGPVRGKDVFIPLDAIIGGPAMAGHGWRMLMECLSIGRSISLPALSTAAATLAYRTTGAYACVRKQFKLPVGRFEGVEEALANIGGATYLLEAMRRLTVSAVDNHIKPALASAIAKYHMTELGRKTMNDAMDVHAGRGIQLGPRNYLGLTYQAMPISITVEGANILTRNLIIFGQGAMMCHPFVRHEVEAVNDPDVAKGFARLDKLLLKHIGYGTSNLLAAFAMGLGASRLLKVPGSGAIAGYYRQLTRMSTALALTADIAMLMLGGALKRKERLSARLGDVLSQLYMAACVLKYYQDNQQTEEDQLYVHWNVQLCLFKMQEAFADFFANFPQQGVARFLHWMIFPVGRTYKKPCDSLGQKIARTMQGPSALRDRLTQYCYYNKQSTDPIMRVEDAMLKMLAAEPLEKKLQEAIRSGVLPANDSLQQTVEAALKSTVLTAEEAELVLAAERARLDAIAVDDFAKLP